MAELQFPNIAGNFLSAYNQSRDQAKADKFAGLAAQALNDPRQRDALLSQAVAIDPTAGFQLSKQLESDTDRRQTQLYNMARGFKQLYNKDNPQPALSFFQQQLAPGLSRLGFPVDPNTPEADIVPVVDQVLAQFGNNADQTQVQSTQILSNGNIGIVTRDGRVVDTGQAAAPQTQLISQPGQVPFLTVTGRGQLGQTIGIGEQGQPAPAPASPVVAHPQTGERGRYSIGGDGLPVFIAEGVAPNVAQTIQNNPADVAAGGVVRGAPQYVEGQTGPRPVRNLTPAETAAATETGRTLAQRDLQRPQDLAPAEQDLRKEVNARLQEPRTVLNAYNKIQAAAKEPSAANDLALIFAYMKILDPGSVVREGEFANAQNAAGIPDRIKNLYNKAVNGQRLNDQQRSEFVSSANGLANTARDQVNSVAREYQSAAKAYGFDVERATGLPDFTGVSATTSTAPRAPQLKGVPTPQTQAEYDRLPSGAVFIDPDDGMTYRKP